MDIQKPIDYLQMFHEFLSCAVQLTGERDAIEREIVKIRQLIGAIFPLLEEAKQKSYQATMESIEAESGGLQDAIRLVFSAQKDKWLTVSDVRDRLSDMGFDFRHYQANPLGSIGTTLKRMVPSLLESSTTEASGTVYRRRDLTPGEFKRRIEANLGRK